mmetsp:Transcript_30864/g.39866  ORF Transcript_30864/g.39866 Transcript_30864/m.39866 type:complete len:487 (-) Transcript_30864:3-1463(-)
MRFFARFFPTSTMMIGFVASLSSSRPLFSRTLPSALSSAAAGRDRCTSSFTSSSPSSSQYKRKTVTLQQGWFSTGTTAEDEKQLLLDPKAPLRPMLAENCHENHLSQYTLPPTQIGADDYRPDLPKGQRIVAFGDVHGDITALRSFLVTAGILDPESSIEEPVWCGGTTICVQTGDVLDRGDDELACFRLLATLARQAHDAGGQLLLLYGNHESLNAAGLFQYANPGGNVEFERTIGARIDYNYGSNRWRLQFAGNQPSRWASFEPGGLLSENMLGNMLVTCVVGRTVFVHAGLMASHLSPGNSINEGQKMYGGVTRLNQQARDWIVTAHHGENNNWGEYNTVEEVISAAQNRAKVASKTMPDCLGGGIGASSPVWMRDYSKPNDAEPSEPLAKQKIRAALAEAGSDVQRMVMGHTPQYKINSALDSMAWRIDVGASQGVMGGTPEVLEIIHMGGDNDEDIVSVLTVDGKRVDGSDRAVFDSSIMF